ncbi:MAG: outer membrane beta-barrel protein [Anaerolineae bacterium]|nr:outer membrane beta-barrel protein [Anaerolineae bacterium]MCI0706764.1 outer membrane beta-barrel protein [Ignavibacteriota bacterium]
MKKFLFTIALVCIVSTVSFAQLGLYSIGAGVGYVSVANDIGGGIGFGAGANLGEIAPGFSLRPEIGYWSVSNDQFGVDVTTSDFIINGNVIYSFMNGMEKSPFYAGAGLGLNFVSAEVSAFGFTASGSETRLGINLLGGAVFPVSPQIMLGGEARYVIVSDFGHFGIQAVIVYTLQ